MNAEIFTVDNLFVLLHNLVLDYSELLTIGRCLNIVFPL